MENIVLPEQMYFDDPVQMPSSRSYQRNFNPSHGSSFKENDWVEFKIPPSNRCYLGKNTSLTFDVETELMIGGNEVNLENARWNNSVDAFANIPVLSFDKCGALGCIDTIQVYDYAGVSLLENIQGHGQLMCLLRDLDTDFFYNKFAGSFAGVAEPNVTRKIRNTPLNTYTYNNANVVTEANTGMSFNSAFELVPDQDASSKLTFPFGRTIKKVVTVTIPLFSFLGVLSEQMVPLHNGFTIKIQLNQNRRAFCFSNPLGLTTVTDCFVGSISKRASAIDSSIKSLDYTHLKLLCDYYELTPESESLLRSQRSSDEMVIHSKSYYHGESFLDPLVREFSHIINCNVRSARNILWFMRNRNDEVQARLVPIVGVQRYVRDSTSSGVLGVADDPLLTVGTAVTNIGTSVLYRSPYSYLSLSNRTRNGLSSWWLRVDSDILPVSSGISCGPEARDMISYTPVDYTGTTQGTNLPVTNVWVDRSCDSLYHLLKTRGDNVRLLNTLFSFDTYTKDSPDPRGYPYSSVAEEIYFAMENATATTETAGGLQQKYNTYATLLTGEYDEYSFNQSGKFAAGINLQARPYSAIQTMSGLNLDRKVVRIEGKFTDNSLIEDYKVDNVTCGTILDSYVEFDSFIKISPAVYTTVSF